MGKRVINYRPLLFVFVGLILGIIISRLFLLTSISRWVLYVALFLILGAVIGVFIYTFRMKNLDANNVFRKNVFMYLRLSTIFLFLALILGMSISILPYRNILSLKPIYDVEVTGTVSRDLQFKDTSTRFILSDCYVKGDSVIRLKFDVCVTTYANAHIDYGDNITFHADLSAYNYSNKSMWTQIASGVGYSTYIGVDDYTINFSNPTIRDRIKNRANDVLIDSMDKTNAGIAMAMLFGDKSNLDDETKDTFAHVGISHILAVSGLHVSIIILVLYFFMKKLRINKWIGFIIYSLILLFYTYLCGFAISVFRASIMGMVLYLLGNIGWEYDSISSLSIAGSIILLFAPLALFTLSFQLSFLCIFSIITLAPTITKLFEKVKCPKLFARAIAISISTTLGLIPVMMEHFASVSLLGILFNLVVIPIFTLVFPILLAVIILSMIFGFFSFLLFIPNLLLYVIRWIAGLGSNIDAFVLHTFRVGYWLLLFTTILCLSIHFLMMKKKFKFIINISLIILILPFVIYGFIPARYSEEQLVINYQTNSNVVYYMYDNEVYLIGSDINSRNLVTLSRELRISKIDNIIAYDFSIKDLQNFTEICENMNVQNVYLPSSLNYDELKERLVGVHIYSDSISLGNIVLRDIVHNDVTIGCEIITQTHGSIIIEKNKISKSHITYLYNEYADSDYLVCNKLNKEVSIDIMSPKNIITHGDSENMISLFEQDKYIFYIGV